ncbi:MAG: hypothetical protein AB7O67_17790 [Vicinamibacterales bacterium]
MRAKSRQEQGLKGQVRALRQRTVSHTWDHRESWREEMCGFGQVGRVTAYAWKSSDQEEPQGAVHATAPRRPERDPEARPVAVEEHAGGVTVRVHGAALEFGGRVARGLVEYPGEGRVNVRLLNERGKLLGRILVEQDASGRLVRRCVSGDVEHQAYENGPQPTMFSRWRRASRKVTRFYDALGACMASGTPSHLAATWLRWGADWQELRFLYNEDGAILEELTLRLGVPVHRVVYTYAAGGELESRRRYEGLDPVAREVETHEYEYDHDGNWTRRFTIRWARLERGETFTGAIHEETTRQLEYYKAA